jgi:hypothetical protein
VSGGGRARSRAHAARHLAIGGGDVAARRRDSGAGLLRALMTERVRQSQVACVVGTRPGDPGAVRVATRRWRLAARGKVERSGLMSDEVDCQGGVSDGDDRMLGFVGCWVLKGMLLLAHTVPNTATQA